MKITKLVHSCLVIEKDSKKIVSDPGSYSWGDEAVRGYDFSGVDAVVITHIHPDHFHEEFANHIQQLSPQAVWYGTPEVVEALDTMGIEAKSSSSDEDIVFVRSDHADLSPWFDVQPEHTSFVLFGEIFISGDCQTITDVKDARILAGAINGGPWGAVVGFAKMIESMESRPEIVIPIHDWHWNEQARDGIYAHLPEVMGKFGIRFESLQTSAAKDM